MSIYDDVHAEAMADYRNERPEPDFALTVESFDAPLFNSDPAETPMWVYECAEEDEPEVSRPGRTIDSHTNPANRSTR